MSFGLIMLPQRSTRIPNEQASVQGCVAARCRTQASRIRTMNFLTTDNRAASSQHKVHSHSHNLMAL